MYYSQNLKPFQKLILNYCLLKLNKFNDTNKIKFTAKILTSIEIKSEIDNDLENYIKTGTVN